jgi:hypothetical protein
LAGVSAAALLFSAAEASADDRTGVLDGRHRRYETPQRFALEFRFTHYTPRIDSAPELNGQTPYRDTFGTMPRLEIATEFDWQVLRIPHLGTLGPGISIGYTSMSAKARAHADPSVVSGENTSLDIFPMYAVMVLRADVFAREMQIPLVPYVKGGVGYALWRAYNDAGTSAAPLDASNPSSDNVSGKGHTFGSHVAVGIALHLNQFDNAAAVNLDNSVGINHTYFFAEYMLSQLTGLGQSHALYVGTNTWTLGLTFEM